MMMAVVVERYRKEVLWRGAVVEIDYRKAG
jgi:hypothetical protein